MRVLMSTVAAIGLLGWSAPSYADACDNMPYSCTFVALSAQASATGAYSSNYPGVSQTNTYGPVESAGNQGLAQTGASGTNIWSMDIPDEVTFSYSQQSIVQVLGYADYGQLGGSVTSTSIEQAGSFNYNNEFTFINPYGAGGGGSEPP
jgi:hypothetical protein